MSVCGKITTSLTESDLNTVFPNGILPTSINDSADRTTDGLLLPTLIASTIVSLKSSGIIPKPDVANSDAYLTKVSQLLTQLKLEYCHYYSRYVYALQSLFSGISDQYAYKTGETTSYVKKYTSYSVTLNRKVNDITQLVKGISEDMMETTDFLDKEIMDLNKKITDQQTKLNRQNVIITSNESAVKIKKEMVKYSQEKGRHTDRLLQLYSFLNIVAVGLLVYVYKAAE